MSDPISLYPDSWVIEDKEMTPLSSTSHVWYSNLIFLCPIETKETHPFSPFVRSTYIYNSTATRITLPLGSWSIPAFKVLGRWTTAHQQFSTCLPVTNRSSVFAESAPFPFSLCTRADAMHSVVFVDILFEKLSCVVLLPITDHG